MDFPLGLLEKPFSLCGMALTILAFPSLCYLAPASVWNDPGHWRAKGERSVSRIPSTVFNIRVSTDISSLDAACRRSLLSWQGLAGVTDLQRAAGMLALQRPYRA